MGAAPSVFQSQPRPGAPMVLSTLPCATIDQVVPLVNIMTFGMCQSTANPAVIAATAAASGVHTPAPCVPVPVGVWAPPAVSSGHLALPLATVASVCACSWAGVISTAVPVPGPAQLV